MNPNLRKYMILAFCGLFLLVIFPLSYLELLGAYDHHPGLNFSASWADNFESSELKDWELHHNNQVKALLSIENGILDISVQGSINAGTIVSAQRSTNLSVPLSGQNYLKVSVRTSSINVIARIVIWEDVSNSKVILLKTYNDTEWHTEVVSLPFFNVTGNVYLIELGMQQLSSSPIDESISFEQLSFCNLDL